MEEIVKLVSDLGFPIVAVIGLSVYLSKRDKERIELERDKDTRIHEHNMKLVQSIEHYRATTNTLLEAVRGMLKELTLAFPE